MPTPAHRRLPLRRRPLRDHGAARLGDVLPLHALPAADRHRRLRAGAGRPGLVSRRRRARSSSASGRRGDDGWPKCFCSDCGGALWSRSPTEPASQRPARDVRRRSRDPAAVAPVRRLRGPVGADPRRRAARATTSARPPDAARARQSRRGRQPRPRCASGSPSSSASAQLLNAIANYAPSLHLPRRRHGARAAICVEPGVRADARL